MFAFSTGNDHEFHVFKCNEGTHISWDKVHIRFVHSKLDACPIMILNNKFLQGTVLPERISIPPGNVPVVSEVQPL